LIERIRYHDLNHQILDQSDVFTVEAFWITQVKLFQRPYQGRIQQTIRGELREQNHSGRIGDVWVPAQQPQVRIAFWLLEADSPDGATNWSILRHSLRKESPHPVLRVL
jgi:hypothetical protein